MQRYHLQKGAGHYGIFSGRKFKHFIVPIIKDFIYDFDKTNFKQSKLKNSHYERALPAWIVFFVIARKNCKF
ncbi:PHB de-polymerase family protein [Rickettsia argasii T170-B]|nr:PHB de-polymerase family protein [Rickettsia argasii T170-B]